MRKILFVTYGGGHVNIINEVAQSLLNAKGVDFNILALTTAYHNLKGLYPKGTVKKISDYNYLFGDIKTDVLYWGNKFVDDNYNDKGVVTKNETIHYIGYSYVDLILNHGKVMAAQIYRENKRNGFLPTTIMKKIILEEDFDTIIATTSPRFELASLIAGNELKKRTIQILDLFGEIHPVPIAKEIITINEDVTKSLKQQGVRSVFYEYGQPSIEKTVNKIKSIDINKVKSKLNISPNKKVLLLATQKLIEFNQDLSKGDIVNNVYVYDKMFNILSNIVNKFKLELVVRVHPNENIFFYKKLLDKYDCKVTFLNEKLDSIESVAICDYLVTHSSTIGLEAMISGKKVFTYNHEFDIRYPLKQLQEKPFIHCYIDLLEKKIKAYLLSEEKNICLERDFMFPFNSVKNIKKLILKE
jgi:hypothetical protein